MFLSDDLRVLPAERHGWLPKAAVAIGIGGAPAVPLDAFPDDPPAHLSNPVIDQIAGSVQQVVPTRWRLPDGGLLLLNVADEALELDGTTVPPRSAVRP